MSVVITSLVPSLCKYMCGHHFMGAEPVHALYMCEGGHHFSGVILSMCARVISISLVIITLSKLCMYVSMVMISVCM